MDTTAQREQWLAAVAAAPNQAALVELDARLFGAKGEVLELMRLVTTLPKEQRPTFGKAANAVKQAVEQALGARREQFAQQALQRQLAASDFDPTEPGKVQPLIPAPIRQAPESKGPANEKPRCGRGFPEASR